jgi:hypothetical protein
MRCRRGGFWFWRSRAWSSSRIWLLAIHVDLPERIAKHSTRCLIGNITRPLHGLMR